MATRNLARTVVEGGRSGYSKLARKVRNRTERRLRFDEEGNIVRGKEHRSGGRGFADRLAPLERWLAHHLGRGWNNVYREFCERFDRRTMKGWHLEEHLLGSVGQDRFGQGTFYVDPRGILRREPRRRRSAWPAGVVSEYTALRWAAGRQVIVHGEALFWTARPIDPLAPAAAQGHRLSPEEATFWSSLSPAVRETIDYNAEAHRRRRALAAGGGGGDKRDYSTASR
jgi:hypothetical protein